MDPDTLSTLPQRHFVNGLAEAVKAALLADPELFSIFEQGDVDARIDEIIYRCLRFKKNIVEQDETEQGMRKALNFGHTLGHGIEAVRGIKGRRTTGLYHGECVALGMLPMIESKTLQKRVRAVYRRLGLPLRASYDKQKVLAEMLHDKKAQAGQIDPDQGAGSGLLAHRDCARRRSAHLAGAGGRGMKNTFGSALSLTIFGESHGPAIGAVLDGMAAGVPVDEGFIAQCMDARRARGDGLSTPRTEADQVHILSGVYQGRTTGSSIALVITKPEHPQRGLCPHSGPAAPGPRRLYRLRQVPWLAGQPGRGAFFPAGLTAGLVAGGAIVLPALEAAGIRILHPPGPVCRCAGHPLCPG